MIAKSMCVVDMTRRCQSKVHTDDPQNPPPISLSAAGWSYRYVYAGSGTSIFLSRLRLRLRGLASSGRLQSVDCLATVEEMSFLGMLASFVRMHLTRILSLGRASGARFISLCLCAMVPLCLAPGKRKIAKKVPARCGQLVELRLKSDSDFSAFAQLCLCGLSPHSVSGFSGPFSAGSASVDVGTPEQEQAEEQWFPRADSWQDRPLIAPKTQQLQTTAARAGSSAARCDSKGKASYGGGYTFAGVFVVAL